MVKAEDAQSLARSTELFIRQQKLAASTAKVLCETRARRTYRYVPLNVSIVYCRSLRGRYLQKLSAGLSLIDFDTFITS